MKEIPEVAKRFIRYAKIATQSSEKTKKIPSTEKQFDLANLLVEELREIGLNDIELDENCVVYATIPSNLPSEMESKVPVICFNSHIDTSTSESDENIQPQVIDYPGGDIILPKDTSFIISPKENPELNDYIGTKIITTDGTTLLGADDKAGIAEIMTAASILVKSGSDKQHGKIRLMFSPDEEIGGGYKAVDLKKLGADFAYTVDGGEMGGLEIANFNAAEGSIVIQGYNVHPGYAFGLMKNSLRAIPEILKLFPNEIAPETTKDMEPYYHPVSIRGEVDKVSLIFILRNFEATDLDNQIKHLEDGVKEVQSHYPDLKISIKIKKSYKNMKDILDKYPYIVEIARKAIQKSGLRVIEAPIRGGTDGARYSYMGLPTPNIFTGGFNFHSKKEFIPIIAMEKAVETIVNIIDVATEWFLDNNEKF
ncbi:peptidase T [Promethearchaeum syntrophicum]|uniref:Peptidase T n=1 Tax=Promethearchaeum syntrophicum TaxID=2594042 RepID=A0A5B9DEM0_9ARCH|nr:peptidase T [Candidatus Prometheoarchaeum syntrophicum]QEE17223.1 peptidase T [Candidatus Prometheoarchaeum syntrophicum]